MKKMLVILTCVMLFTAIAAADGPVDQGSFQLGGNVYFESASGELYKNPKGESQSTLVFAPTIGHFVIPGLLIGADVQFLHTWQGDYSNTGIAAGPVIGFYYDSNPARSQIKGAVYPYIKGFMNFGHLSGKYPLYSNDEVLVEIEMSQSDTKYGGEAGAVFMLSNTTGINFNAALTARNVSVDYESSDPNLRFLEFDESGLTFSFGAGVTYFIY